jgi:hypothetical protein
VPYKTIWAEYADIQDVGKAIGATPTDKRPSGEPRYTLPSIIVPATGEVVSNSAKIAAYLEAKYPDKPLFPEGKVEEHLAYERELTMLLGIVCLCFHPGPHILTSPYVGFPALHHTPWI